MPDLPTSLLDLPRQASLPLAPDLAAEARYDEESRAVAPAPRNPIFSGERLYRSDPERYALFCRLYFESGLSQMEACRLLNMSPQSGAAIISREQSSMSASRLRQVQAARARAVVSLSLSAMQDRLSDPEALAAAPLRDLAQAAQRAHEIAALLSGEATSRTDRPEPATRPAGDAADYLRAVDAECVPAAQPILPGESEVACGAAGSSEGATDGADQVGVDAQADGLAGGAHDSESWVSGGAGVAAQGVTSAAMPAAMPEAGADGVAARLEGDSSGARIGGGGGGGRERGPYPQIG